MSLLALEGVVQLDRSGPPPRVMYDTRPVRQVDVAWRDVLGCWLMRVKVDPMAGRQAETFEVLIVNHYGPFVRIPGEDAFWPAGERYGLRLESVAATAQSNARQATQQLRLELATPSHTLGNLGTKVPRPHKKGRRR